jgi:hypothetical protein
LGSCLSFGTPLELPAWGLGTPCTHVALRLRPQCLAHHCVRVALGLPAWGPGTPSAQLALGLRCAASEPCPCHTLGHGAGSRVLCPRILNIIICFRNVIIFITINMINKIINKFERKYYY